MNQPIVEAVYQTHLPQRYISAYSWTEKLYQTPLVYFQFDNNAFIFKKQIHSILMKYKFMIFFHLLKQPV